jgi:hypothetical protein
MIQVVGELGTGSIPVGAVIHVQRKGMSWCCDTQGNTYELNKKTDLFEALITRALSSYDCIYTGTNKEEVKCVEARSYSWRLPRRWTITLARSAMSSSQSTRSPSTR